MLKDCIPIEFASTKQMGELFHAEQPEIDLLFEEIERIKNDLHILTCSEEHIANFEYDYGLDTDVSLTLEQRKTRVMAAKYRRLLPKIETLESLLKNLLGADSVKILEGNCMFSVYVETMRMIDNFEIANAFFKEVRPAHFGYKFINALPREYEAVGYMGIAPFVFKKMTMEVAG